MFYLPIDNTSIQYRLCCGYLLVRLCVTVYICFLSFTLSPLTAQVEELKCNMSDYTYHTNHALKVHTGRQHKNTKQPEVFRSEALNNS